MSIEFLDPTYESEAQVFSPAPRLDTLEGKTIGIVSNGKQGTSAFFLAFEQHLREHFKVREVVQTTKANYSAPAESALMQQARSWDALVAGIGD